MLESDGIEIFLELHGKNFPRKDVHQDLLWVYGPSNCGLLHHPDYIIHGINGRSAKLTFEPSKKAVRGKLCMPY